MSTESGSDLSRIEPAFMVGGGTMGDRVRAYDWASTSVGPPDAWPHGLRSVLHLLLSSRHPMFLWWGADLVQFFNDGYRPSLGDRDEAALGARGREFWAEIWPVIGPQIEDIMSGGPATWHEDHLVPITRHGGLQEVYWTYSYSPVLDDDGTVGGVLVTVQETTPRVLTERRIGMLRELGERTVGAAGSTERVVRAAGAVLAGHPEDVAFAAIYLRAGARLEQTATTGADVDASLPGDIDLGPRGAEDDPVAKALAAVAQDGRTRILDDLQDVPGTLPGGRWPEPARHAAVVAIGDVTDTEPLGAVVLGASPRLPFDDAYREVFELVAREIGAAVAQARAYQRQRQRAESLARLDRAKSEFFSNVSHEFRTPLTLILGPLRDVLHDDTSDLGTEARDLLTAAHRNAMRLERLVNALLDFSRVEAGGAEGRFEETDLAALTSDLASAFRSLVESAGLDYRVHLESPGAAVFVDRAMWETIVLNLLSNAFKFTLSGAIEVSLRSEPGAAVLEISDTGSGIPAAELPRLFERFHRVGGARGRTMEGTGIGLALVRELVRLHGGDVSATSALDEGSTFQVRIPTGHRHLPEDRVVRPGDEAESGGDRESPGAIASAFVEESRRWLAADGDAPPLETPGDIDAPGTGSVDASESEPPRILVVDDNVDMRDYVRRLLRRAGFVVEVAEDGGGALAAVRAHRPDLVVADVMMPVVDGFELLGQLRAHPGTRDLPVILLSARAGEEARVDGLRAGADDYLVKPFTAQHLLERVRLRLETARARRDAYRRLVELFETAPVAISVVAGPDHVYELANHRYRAMVGGRDVLGKPIRQAFPELPPDAEVVAMLDRVRRTGETFEADEYLVPLETDGALQDRFFQFTCLPFRASDGETTLLSVAVDVTGRVQARREAEEARRMAEDANAAKGAFLATMSHELRTPLNAILGYADLLTAGVSGELNDAQTGHVRRITGGARHLLGLIEEVLTFSRIEAGELQVDLAATGMAELVENTAEMIRPLATQKGLDFRLDLADRDTIVHTDEHRLRQILLNLLGNAIKFTDSGTVTLSMESTADSVVLRVADTGIGIPGDQLQTVFEPFRQIRKLPGSSGTGLGLSVSRELARLVGGELTVTSEEGVGSVFELTIPR